MKTEPRAYATSRRRWLLLAVTAAGLGASDALAAPIPDDIQVQYEVYVRGKGWDGVNVDGDIAGATEAGIPIEGIRLRFRKWNGTSPSGYSVCYRALREGQAKFDAEVCNWKTAGTPGGKPIQALSIYIKTPPSVAGSLCYATHDKRVHWSNRVCDGGYVGRWSGEDTGHYVSGIYTYLAGGTSRGPHPRSVYELSTTDRTEYGKKLSECINHDLLMHHHDMIHEPTWEFLEKHRHFVHMMESCMTKKAKKFVPLPHWNPGQTVPKELRAVKKLTNHASNALQRYDVIENHASPMSASKPAELVAWDICWLKAKEGWESLPDDERWAEENKEQMFLELVNNWHNGVHDSLGGVMADPMDSPVAVIFWPWHAYVDNIYQQWLDCPRPPAL